MRDIKFRAWNYKDSNPDARMIYPATLTAHGKVIMPDSDEWDIPVMQFTGLHDKTGKDIYEGDILIDGDSEPCRHRIVWLDDQAKFEIETWEGDGSWSSGLFDYLAEMVDVGNVLNDFEVIGNIYENPELLQSASE